jgi:hypothetical protein
MIDYEKIRNNAAQFQSLTSLSVAEFDLLHEDFSGVYARWIEKYTLSGKPRTRRYSERHQGDNVFTTELKQFFILKYMKENKLQESLAAEFDMTQSMANKWIHVLLPLLEKALRAHQAERQGGLLAEKLDKDGQYSADCTVRTVQRDSYDQELFFDGKKKHIQ